MTFDSPSFFSNPFVLIFISIVTGLMIGKLQLGRFSLGISGCLFSGLLFGWSIYKTFALPYEGLEDIPPYASQLLENNVIPVHLFSFTLILFIAAVGLLAAKDLNKIFKRYGLRFAFLGFVVTFTGAIVCYLMTYISAGQNAFAVSGVYTGALTSSPGLAAAIEAVSGYAKEAEMMVGFGHAVGYIPGVLVIILAMQFFPLIFKIDVELEQKNFQEEMYQQVSGEVIEDNQATAFDVIGFTFVCLTGFFLGKIKLYLGATINYFSLGLTGGVLIAALVLGYIGRVGPINFRMNNRVLDAIRQISLALFLAIVGLRYGYTTVNSISGSGAYLVWVSFICAVIALLVGYFVGRHVFKMNWIILSGALCGGMTSTPGLGAAIDATKSDHVAAGYGATYPFALFGMIIFAILLHKLPI